MSNNNTKKTDATQTEMPETTSIPFMPGTRLEVFSVKERRVEGNEKQSVWVRAGTAFVNRDGSMNVYLDVLPLDGKLHIRRTVRGETTARGFAFRRVCPALARSAQAPVSPRTAPTPRHDCRARLAEPLHHSPSHFNDEHL